MRLSDEVVASSLRSERGSSPTLISAIALVMIVLLFALWQSTFHQNQRLVEEPVNSLARAATQMYAGIGRNHLNATDPMIASINHPTNKTVEQWLLERVSEYPNVRPGSVIVRCGRVNEGGDWLPGTDANTPQRFGDRVVCRAQMEARIKLTAGMPTLGTFGRSEFTSTNQPVKSPRGGNA